MKLTRGVGISGVLALVFLVGTQAVAEEPAAGAAPDSTEFQVGATPDFLYQTLEKLAQTNPASGVPVARTYLRTTELQTDRGDMNSFPNEAAHFFAGLILFRAGYQEEGLKALEPIFGSDDEGYWIRHASQDLISTHNAQYFSIVESALDRPDFEIGIALDALDNQEFLLKLFRLGSEKTLDYLIAGLNDRTVVARSITLGVSRPERPVTRKEQFAEFVRRWRLDYRKFVRKSWSLDVQAEVLTGWLKDQFAIVRQGGTPKMRDSQPLDSQI